MASNAHSNGADGTFILHDIDLLPGMSGGPIFDGMGRLIAIQQAVERINKDKPLTFDNYKFIVGIPFDAFKNELSR